MITGGFGTTMDLERGTSRQWVVGRDGVKRWVDTLSSCEVGGLPLPSSKCGALIDDGQLCGHDGECQHKVPNA